MSFAGTTAGERRPSQKVLAEQLRALEANGIIHRERTGKPPAPVMCSLTEYGRSLVRTEEHP